MEKQLIYIVDDEPDILELVDVNLKKSGFSTKAFEDTLQLKEEMNKNIPDLLILDLMLPFTDGLEICKQLRSDNKLRNVPIIMLTAKSDEMDKILGLELGADDYITKPFSPRELVARVKSVLRRSKPPTEEEEILKIGDSVEIHTKQYFVKINGVKVDLTHTEIKILYLLASRKGWVFSRDQILNHLWGKEKIVVDRTVDVHINHLRKKMGSAGRYLKNVRGIGYKIEDFTNL